MKIPVIYEDENILVIDKPAGITVFPEGKTKEKTLRDHFLEEYSWMKNVGTFPRYGIVHRLDKDTSGILLIAKNNEAFSFLQDQFKNKLVEKKYLTLVSGKIKDKEGIVETLIGRAPKDRRKQKVYLKGSPEAKKEGLREAKTIWKVVEVFPGKKSDYALLEVNPKTGRKHQIRTHLAYLDHPVVGDKLYSFKNQILPEGLTRQFLHAFYLKISLPDGKEIEFKTELPPELKKVLKTLTTEKQKYEL